MNYILSKLFLILLILPCLGWSSLLVAQEVIFQTQRFGVEEGLSHRDVKSIHQDSSGVLWIGTQYGLNRFDGYNFKWYTKETHELQSNVINHIFEQTDGLLWLFDTQLDYTKNVYSIDIFDPVSEQAVSFEQYFQEQAPFAAKDIESFNFHVGGEVRFITRDKKVFAFSKGTFQFICALDSEWDVSITYATDDLIWLTKFEALNNRWQLLLFNREGKQLHQFTHENAQRLRIYAVGPDGTCSYFTSNAQLGEAPVFYKATVDGKHLPNPIYQNPEFVETLKGYFRPHEEFAPLGEQYWYEDDKGLVVFDTRSKTHYRQGEHFEAHDRLQLIFADQTGTVWIGTAFGLTKIQLKEKNFHTVFFRDNTVKLPTRGMSMDEQGRLWVVPEGRRMLFKVEIEGTKPIETARYRFDETALPLPSNYYAIAKVNNGNISYLSGNKLVIFNPENFTYSAVEITSKDVTKGYGWVIYEDEFGKVWFGTNDGALGYWDGQKVNWPTGLGQLGHCYHFHKTRDGKTWLATAKGLYVLDLKQEKILEHYWSGGRGKYHLPFDNIYHFLEDDDGTFWLATGGTGLVQWEHSTTGQATQFTRAHGLNNTIYAVYEDKYNHLWLPSDLGIIRFNKESRQIQTYLVEDGISYNEFNRISHHQAPDGRLFFGSLDGITIFDPNNFQSEFTAKSAPLIISDFQQFDKDGLEIPQCRQMLFQENNITFHPGDRFFRLEFALLTYDNVGENRYAYQIEGIDKDWNYQKENFLRFARLPYGKHELRIKGQNAYGQWSKQELRIQLQVLRPFYLQTWFILASIFAVILLGFGWYKRRTNQLKLSQRLLEEEVARQTQEIRAQAEEIREQAEELKSLEKLKSRFFANVSHELRTPLTLMLGPMDTLLKRDYWKNKDRNLMQFAQQNGKQLLKLVNEILDLSKIEDSKLEVRETNINFFDFLQPIIAQFRSFGDSVAVKLILDYRADQHLVLATDTDKFEKIAHNFLSNALKFTPKDGQVELIIEEVENEIVLQVKDNGKGIHPEDLPHIFDRFYQSKQPNEPEQGGTGIGLSLSKELAGLLGGRVWAESELGKGSTFFFRFPKKITTTYDVAKTPDMIAAPVPPQAASTATGWAEITDLTDAIPEVQVHGNNAERPTLLIVEDNPDLRNYIQIILEEDFQVTTAENGQQAWDLLSATPDKFNLIVSDLMMPFMDGFQLLEKIKQHDALRHLPVIMLTARADAKVKMKALRVGVDDYLIKPFIEEELKVRIKNLLGNLQERLKAYSDSLSNKPRDPQPERPVIGEADAEWLAAAEQVLEKMLNDRQFTLEWAAQQLHLSKRQFHRKIKQLTGLSPNLYLREMRLQKAHEYIHKGTYRSVKEVAAAVNFSDPKYFSKLFQQRFGILPSEQL